MSIVNSCILIPNPSPIKALDTTNRLQTLKKKVYVKQRSQNITALQTDTTRVVFSPDEMELEMVNH
jgi:hypothetical protein